MKEYTLTYTAEITEVIKSDAPLYDKDKNAFVKNAIANWIGSKLDVDDVHVKDIKVFERDI